MNRLLELLLHFLTLGVEEGDPDTGGVSATAPVDDNDDAGTGDQTLDEIIDAVETSEATRDSGVVDEAAVTETRRRLRERETELENERRLRFDAEARASRVATPQGVDPVWQAEENEIAAARAAGATTEQLSWVQWKVDSSRRLRMGEQTSRMALLQANDLNDRTEFGRLEITKPTIYKRYAKRVEEAVEKMRQAGQNAPRLGILKLLIGDDLIAGNLRPATKKKATASPDGTVARGASPNMRSDVSGKGGTSEREKRRARLENVRL